VDSIGKKITVVKNVVEGLGLTNVRAEQVRGEEIRAKYDFVISRAVTRMREFYGWVRNKAKPQSVHSLDNGILYLKGGDLDEELDELGTMYATYSLPDYFEEEFFLTKKLVFIPL
jgi:16S rRNA (guanine527-N7)-methyltransferase